MPTPQNREPGRRPRNPDTERYTMQGDWAVPNQHPTAPPQRRAPTQEQRRAAARRRREIRRRRRRLAVLGTVGGVLVLSGIITVLLPKSVKGETEAAPLPTADPAGTRLVAPLPYAGAGDSGSQNAQTLNWGTVGPQRQTADTGYTYTALPAKPAALPEFGRVDTSWFADAAFLGDSLTAGFCANEYNIDVGGALICGYEGISPNTVVNRTTVTSPDRGEEVPLDVLAAAQPKKLYILLGTNTLTTLGASDRFLAYYGQMLDMLREALGPDCVIYVESVPPVRPKAAAEKPGLASDVLRGVNEQLAQLAASKGCVYLDLWETLADGEGNLKEMLAAPDGVHLSAGNGYGTWLTYLRNHAKYSANNSWTMGSVYSAQ